MTILVAFSHFSLAQGPNASGDSWYRGGRGRWFSDSLSRSKNRFSDRQLFGIFFKTPEKDCRFFLGPGISAHFYWKWWTSEQISCSFFWRSEDPESKAPVWSAAKVMAEIRAKVAACKASMACTVAASLAYTRNIYIYIHIYISIYTYTYVYVDTIYKYKIYVCMYAWMDGWMYVM